MIKKVLIANRGEIACRIIKTCRAMGIATVAVYSEVDSKALHVEIADECVPIGPAPAAESYLKIDTLIKAAKKTKADAVHPGYGFLSESADFATACAQAGLIFIGPPASAIAAMGSKSQAKDLMQKAGVPLVPGYHGARQEADFLLDQAKAIGFPVLIKASAGGGGKGMRVVHQEKEFLAALAAAQREARASFGDDHLLIEKYIQRPRHVEVQILADAKGNVVYLSDRDCSIQRRHQKVIEEAPAFGLDVSLRERMGQAAVNAAKAVDYVGAGTVEFLLDQSGAFYFMEMNTRLQVEHPVTEMVTGLDLVRLQISVAQGEALSFTQQDIRSQGHAIEARLYAEDPLADFLPGAGHIKHLKFCSQTENVRIDTGVRAGDEISIFYDPMIAKIIVRGEDRTKAITLLQQALDQTHIAGLKTNLSFLRLLSRHDSFAAGAFDTGFIDHHKSDLLRPYQPSSKDLSLAVLGLLHLRQKETQAQISMTQKVASPWDSLSNWRMAQDPIELFRFDEGLVQLRYQGENLTLSDAHAASEYQASFRCDDKDPNSFTAVLGDETFSATLLRQGNKLTLLYDGVEAVLHYQPLLQPGEIEDDRAGSLQAPMPGKVVAVLVKPGDHIRKGQAMIIVEAMKMEHTLSAPADGVVRDVFVGIGDQVDDKETLLALD